MDVPAFVNGKVIAKNKFQPNCMHPVQIIIGGFLNFFRLA